MPSYSARNRKKSSRKSSSRRSPRRYTPRTKKRKCSQPQFLGTCPTSYKAVANKCCRKKSVSDQLRVLFPNLSLSKSGVHNVLSPAEITFLSENPTSFSPRAFGQGGDYKILAALDKMNTLEGPVQ